MDFFLDNLVLEIISLDNNTNDVIRRGTNNYSADKTLYGSDSKPLAKLAGNNELTRHGAQKVLRLAIRLALENHSHYDLPFKIVFDVEAAYE